MTATLYHGDCLHVMPALEEASVDAVICDPPYGLGFMGKAWDRGVPGVPFWREAKRVARPGAYLLAFGGTRTAHRLTCAIEDAGWEIHDVLCWLYGSGFPKHDSKLKPAWEPVIMAWSPAESATALNIDACRLATDDALRGGGAPPYTYYGTNARPFHEKSRERRYTGGDARGRWPANVIIDEQSASLIDEQSGELTSGANPTRRGSNKFANTYGDFVGQTDCAPARGVDRGGASRFYYCAKVSRAEREAGITGERKALNWSSGTQNPGSFQSEGVDRTARNHHPTVKPIALMRWLARLVTPAGGVVLDPFAGSGSTGCAAGLEGLDFIGIEKDEDGEGFVDIAAARIAHWSGAPVTVIDARNGALPRNTQRGDQFGLGV